MIYIRAKGNIPDSIFKLRGMRSLLDRLACQPSFHGEGGQIGKRNISKIALSDKEAQHEQPFSVLIQECVVRNLELAACMQM